MTRTSRLRAALVCVGSSSAWWWWCCCTLVVLVPPVPRVFVRGVPTSIRSSSSSATTTTTSANASNNNNNKKERPHNPAHDTTSSLLFWSWCHSVLGIQTTSLRIQTFDYFDYMQAHWLEDDLEDTDGSSFFCDNHPQHDATAPPLQQQPQQPPQEEQPQIPTVETLPRIPVRGLQASHNISIGDVLISIPLYAMISVPTTIDHDPVLSRVLGPQARAKHGWEENAYFELPLLTVALLYHQYHLGSDSPLQYYMELLLDQPNQSMPTLWSKTRLRRDVTEGVRRIARGIQKDVYEMYKNVMVVLMEEHPELFGRAVAGEAYSYANFQWAFAMVNSRHWSLPIPDLDLVHVDLVKRRDKSGTGGTLDAPRISNLATPAAGDQVIPPAEQPTESWVHRQQDEVEPGETTGARATDESPTPHSHSFLAPVADLLNFGPPCTRGQYNAESKTFELIATCPFQAGQEVTYWYSDDCDDVIIANYGFTHPMVPRCPSVEDWREQAEGWRQRAEVLDVELTDAYAELEQLDTEIDQLHSLIDKCDCDDDYVGRRTPRTEGSRKQSKKLRHDGHEAGVRGAGTQKSQTDHERNRIRRKWPNKKSDLGL